MKIRDRISEFVLVVRVDWSLYGCWEKRFEFFMGKF